MDLYPYIFIVREGKVTFINDLAFQNIRTSLKALGIEIQIGKFLNTSHHDQDTVVCFNPSQKQYAMMCLKYRMGATDGWSLTEEGLSHGN